MTPLRLICAASLALLAEAGCTNTNPLPASADIQFDRGCGEDINLALWSNRSAVLFGELQAVRLLAPSTECPAEEQLVALSADILVEQELTGRHPELEGLVQQVLFHPNGYTFGNPIVRVAADGTPTWERVGEGPGDALREGQALGVGVVVLDGSRWLGTELFTVNDGLEFQQGSVCVSGKIDRLQGASIDEFSTLLRATEPEAGGSEPMDADEVDLAFRSQCPGPSSN